MEEYEIKDGVGIIPEGTVNIGMYAFKEREELREVIIPDTVVEIETNAFKGCVNLEKVIFPDSLQIIGVGAFEGCANLKSVVLPDSVTSILDSAFYHTDLTEIIIPKSVKTIGHFAFSSNHNLKKITILGWIRTNPFEAFSDCDSIETVYVPAGKGESYKKRVTWCVDEKFLNIIVELPEEKKVKKPKINNELKKGGKFYLTIDGTYKQIKHQKLSKATDEKVKSFLEDKANWYWHLGSSHFNSLKEEGDAVYNGTYLIDPDKKVKMYLYSAPADIDEKTFKEEKPVLGGSAIKKAIKTIRFNDISKVHYEWGYESDKPDETNDAPEDYNANKLASEIPGLGDQHHLLNDYVFSQGWHVISVADMEAASRPTTFLITTEEPFDIKRLQIIIVSVEELTNFYCWSFVAGAVYDNQLLPVVDGNPTKNTITKEFLVKISENGAFNEMAYDKLYERWNND